MRYFIVAIITVFAFYILGAQVENSNNINQQNLGPWKAPQSANELKNPFKNLKESAVDGKNLFNQYCVTCHGDEGQGNGPTGASLNPKPADLQSKQVQGQSDGAIFWKITNGRGMMMAWKFSLSDKQRWYLVNYIRELAKK